MGLFSEGKILIDGIDIYKIFKNPDIQDIHVPQNIFLKEAYCREYRFW